jgi:hypothetical protein
MEVILSIPLLENEVKFQHFVHFGLVGVTPYGRVAE